MKKKNIGDLIQNLRDGTGVRRCAHNYDYAECPYHFCAGRAMLEALVRIDRQAMSAHPIGHDAIIAVRAALRLAGEKPAPAPPVKPWRGGMAEESKA